MNNNYSLLDFSDDNTATIQVKRLPRQFDFLAYLNSPRQELAMIEKDLQDPQVGDRAPILLKSKAYIAQHMDWFAQRETTQETTEYALTQEDEQLIISNIQLAHSVSWYLIPRIDSTVKVLEERIRLNRALAKAITRIDDIILILRRSRTPEEASARLREELHFPKYLADYLCNNITLNQIATINPDWITRTNEELNQLIAFVQSLK